MHVKLCLASHLENCGTKYSLLSHLENYGMKYSLLIMNYFRDYLQTLLEYKST